MRAVAMIAGILLGIAGSSYISLSEAATARAEFNTTLVSVRAFDIGLVGPTVGDTTITRWRITDREGTTQGFAHQVCRWTTSRLRLCTGVYGLSTGSIVFEGLVGRGMPLAVTGGTGEYEGVSGHLTRHGRTVQFVLRI